MTNAHAPPPDAAQHRRALLALAGLAALSALPLAEGFAHASGAQGLAGAFVRLAAASQMGALFALLAVLHLPLAATGSGRAVLRGAAPAAFALAWALLLLDLKVFSLFRFHLNRTVLELVLAPGGLASLRLSRGDQGRAAAVLAALLLGAAMAHALFLRLPAGALPERSSWRRALGAVLALLVADRAVYAWADVTRRRDVLRASDAVPAYGPIPVRRLLGLARGAEAEPVSMRPRPGFGAVSYAAPPGLLPADSPAPPIVWIVLDSWRGDAMDSETTPNVAALGARGTVFRRHASGGNSTGHGIFSMFYGLHGAYLDSFDAARQPPALLSALRARGYEFGVFSSARLSSPPLRSTVFAEVPEAIHDVFPGDAPSRDRAATDGALAFVRERAAGDRPWFLFLFLDSSHALYDFPRDQARFTPYAESMSAAVVASAPPGAVWNRYRNALHYEDSLVGEVLAALGPRASEAIILIVGDHGEAFGEGGRWFHNSGFGQEQWHVPLVLSAPALGRGVREELTRGVDLPPTILGLLHGTAEAPGLGHSLLGAEAGADHAVVCGLRAYAIVEGDGTTTVVPNGTEDWGALEIQGPRYEPLQDRRVSVHLADVLEELRRYVR